MLGVCSGLECIKSMQRHVHGAFLALGFESCTLTVLLHMALVTWSGKHHEQLGETDLFGARPADCPRME